jgi:hypothetical protein
MAEAEAQVGEMTKKMVLETETAEGCWDEWGLLFII